MYQFHFVLTAMLKWMTYFIIMGIAVSQSLPADIGNLAGYSVAEKPVKDLHGFANDPDRMRLAKSFVPLVVTKNALILKKKTASGLGPSSDKKALLRTQECNNCSGDFSEFDTQLAVRYKAEIAGNLKVICTGVLVAPNVIATAKHCATNISPKDLRFIFGYYRESQSNDSQIIEILKSNIYSGMKFSKNKPFIGYEKCGNADWVLIKLELKKGQKGVEIFGQPVKKEEIDKVIFPASPPALAENDNIFMIGYPFGLPLKITVNKQVLDATNVNSNPNSCVVKSFESDLPNAAGFSGAPIFNTSGQLVGLHKDADNNSFGVSFSQFSECLKKFISTNKGCEEFRCPSC